MSRHSRRTVLASTADIKAEVVLDVDCLSVKLYLTVIIYLVYIDFEMKKAYGFTEIGCLNGLDHTDILSLQHFAFESKVSHDPHFCYQNVLLTTTLWEQWEQ